MKGKQIKRIIKEAINSLKKQKLNEQTFPAGCENIEQDYAGMGASICSQFLAGTLSVAGGNQNLAQFIANYNLETCCQGFEAGPNVYEDFTPGEDPCYVCASTLSTSNQDMINYAQSIADENGIMALEMNPAPNYLNVYTNEMTYVSMGGGCSALLSISIPGGSQNTSTNGSVYYNNAQANCPVPSSPSVSPDAATMGGVKPGTPNLATPVKGPTKQPNVSPVGMAPQQRRMMREQVERMQKLANIESKK